MFYAKQGNQVCRIEEQQIDALVEQGFDILDDSGKVLRKAVPTDINLLKKYYVELTKQVAELTNELETLKKASSQKKSVAKKEEKVEEVTENVVDEPKNEEEVVAKPKRGRK